MVCILWSTWDKNDVNVLDKFSLVVNLLNLVNIHAWLSMWIIVYILDITSQIESTLGDHV
jgi:hypothetical protein